MKSKAILLMNTTSSIGGAQKRYLSLFNYIISKRDDYYLIVNKLLYIEFKDNNFLSSNKNVHVIDLGYCRNSSKDVLAKKNVICKTKPKKKKYQLLRKVIWLFRKFLNWVSFAKQFRKIQKEYGIKTVYSVWIGGIWAWPLRYLYNFTLIHSYNDSSLSSLSNSFFRFFDSEYWVLKNCDKIDFLSAGIIPRLENKIGQINETKKLITPNSFILYDNYFPKYPKENIVIFMARLTSIKNPLLFLKAVKLYLDKYRENEVNFYILGVGTLEGEIIDYIKKHDLRNVHFRGAVFKPWDYLKKSKVFVSLQRDENYPSQSILEAMACENAIIASDVGETRKLVTENEGLLVNLIAEEIAEAINKLIINPNLTRNLGRNARKKVITEHTIEKFSEYFYSITNY